VAEGEIVLPVGLSGPRLRAAEKDINGVSKKEIYVVEGSAPWRVDRSYRIGSPVFGDYAFAAAANWPFIFGYASTAPAGSAIAIRSYQFGIGSSGTSAGAVLLLAFARTTDAPVGGTTSTAVVKNRLSYAAHSAVVRYGSTATLGQVFQYLPFNPATADRYSTRYFPRRRFNGPDWTDAIVLLPGEYVGVKITSGTPNGHERLAVKLEWEEVTL